MLCKITRVEDGCELGAPILAIGTEVTIQFLERGELGVGGRGLMRIGSLVDDADGITLIGGLFQDRHEMACESDVAKVVDGHVSVDPIIGKLVSHYPPRCVVDQDVDTIGLLGDLVGDMHGLAEVRKIDLEPDHLLGGSFTKLFCHGFCGAIDDFFGWSKDEDFGNALVQEGVRATVALD